MGKNSDGLCSVLGCDLPFNERYRSGDNVAHWFWCEPHGLQYEFEERHWRLTEQRIKRARASLTQNVEG